MCLLWSSALRSTLRSHAGTACHARRLISIMAAGVVVMGFVPHGYHPACLWVAHAFALCGQSMVRIL